MQTLNITATEAPQIIATDPDLYNMWIPLIMSLLMLVVLALAANGILKPVYACSLVGIIFITLICGGLYIENGKNSMQQTTQNNISRTLNDKYGVKPADNVILYKANSSVPLGLHLSLNDGRIPVVTKDDKDIEVVLELVNDGTDVKAYSLGAELPVLEE